jgi:hypothetical protein
MREVDDDIAKREIELADEVDMKLTKDKNISHSNAWRTHRETNESLKKSRGNIYSLLIGWCTQVLVDKMKQDVDWVMISESFEPILLFKLIEKFVLKQSNNQYRTAVLIAKLKKSSIGGNKYTNNYGSNEYTNDYGSNDAALGYF